jgi:hypothetical protein
VTDPAMGTVDPAAKVHGGAPPASSSRAEVPAWRAPAALPSHPTAALLAGAGLPALCSGDGEEERARGGGPTATAQWPPRVACGSDAGVLLKLG